MIDVSGTRVLCNTKAPVVNDDLEMSDISCANV